MAPSFSDLKVILLQARNTKDMESQEQDCFLERSKLERHQLSTFNVAHGNLIETHNFFDGYDAFFIGGAGEYSVAKDYDWTPWAMKLIQRAYDVEIPTFGSCWGHQLIARGLGGTVEHDPDRAELGCHHVRLTEQGMGDELFAAFPDSFLVNMGHHDRVTKLPDNGIELADNDSQPFEAFRIENRAIYGTQFHSELDARRERERLIRYRSYYVEQLHSEEVFQNIMNTLAETTDVDHLMFDFLTKFAVR